MPDWSRRRFLCASVAAVIGGLAGCSGFPDRAGEPVDVSGRSNRPVSEYDATTVRNADGAALLDSESDRSRRYYDHLTEAERVPAFSDVTEARELSRFAAATDFETESMLLLVRPIPECYELRLTSVTRDDDGVDSDYCRELRPADVSCDSDAEDTVGVAIRLPFAGDSFNSLGMGFSRSCGDRPTVVRLEPVTPAADATATPTTSETDSEGGTE